jgi:hypothetical protein
MVLPANQVHLNAPGCLVIYGKMTPIVQVKIRIKFSINPAEQVQIKL